MNKKLDHFIELELEKFPDQDVLIYYKREHLELTYGFFAWGGNVHVRTTISELIQDGFEKSEIKELRSQAKKIFITENSLSNFEVKYG